MITIFSSPKHFRGHFAIIQRNAIKSWSLLHPRCDVLLFGDEEGTREMAYEIGAHHIPNVTRNPFGTPLLSDMFEKARLYGAHGLLCFVNSDIILMSDIMHAARKAASFSRWFMMIGERWNIDIESPLDFGLEWETRLHHEVHKTGWLQYPPGVDYFLFPKGVVGNIPPFAIGRPAWDNWLLYHARRRGALLIDATDAVVAVHQNHDYSHVAGGGTAVWRGPEAQQNRSLYKMPGQFFTFEDATHRLTRRGVELAIDYKRIVRHIETLPTLHPLMRIPMWLPSTVIGLWRRKRIKLNSFLPKQ